MDTAKVLKAMLEGVVKLDFDDGYIKATLDPEVTGSAWKINQSPNSEELVVWDIYKRTWSTFRVDAVRKVQYRIGG
jgi:hypothetical protein